MMVRGLRSIFSLGLIGVAVFIQAKRFIPNFLDFPIDQWSKSLLSIDSTPPTPPPTPRNSEGGFNASSLFDNVKNSVYQIRVINEVTGQKIAVGSGFLVGDGSLIATNYHVVNDAVQKGNYRLEFVDNNDVVGRVELIAVDVIHDLAIVKADKVLGVAFQIADVPEQGAPLYALGNPHDLGFIIAEGTNNGLLKKSAQARILFSGALNSGMSGGPTLNQYGKVVGVNVSYLRQSNSISFVVPARYLASLLDQVDKSRDIDINATIADQLYNDNINYFSSALQRSWQQGSIAKFSVPLSISDDVRCWDSSPFEDVDDLIGIESISCFNDRNIFINDEVSMGLMGYSFTHYFARDSLYSSRFYRLYSQAYEIDFYQWPRRDYGNFECKAGFVQIADKPFKTTLCRQSSRQFFKSDETIDDIYLIAAQIGESSEGMIINISLNGVQTALGKAVIARILEKISWRR